MRRGLERTNLGKNFLYDWHFLTFLRFRFFGIPFDPGSDPVGGQFDPGWDQPGDPWGVLAQIFLPLSWSTPGGGATKP